MTCGVLQVDKLQFVLYMKDVPTGEGRNAELALWRRCSEEAEKISAGRVVNHAAAAAGAAATTTCMLCVGNSAHRFAVVCVPVQFRV